MTQTVIKLIGGAVTVIAAVMWGQGKIRTERKKTDELAALCRLVRYIGDNIEHFSRPLPEIYADFDDEILRREGFIEALKKDGMKTALGKGLLTVDGEAIEEMERFADRIGGDYREEQTELCEYTRSHLTGYVEERKKNSHDKEKLYRTCPVLLALSAVLMFI